MRIFYSTSVLGDVGGSEIYTRDLLTELIRRGHEIFVFTTCNYELKGAQTHIVPTRGHHAFHKFEAPFFYKDAIRDAEKFKPDIVQSHSNSLMGWIGSRVRKKVNVPHVLLIELISSENHNLHTKTIHEMEKFLLPRLDVDKIIVWTRLIKEKFLLPWGVPNEKIEVIPPAINIDNYSIADPKQIQEKYGQNLITSFKSLWGSSARGIEYILQAMPIVFERFPEYRYVIFGGGKEQARLEKKAQELGISDKVFFHGYEKPQMGASIAAATTVSPHSFVYEISFSMSLMEYMAWGVPCVVTDIGSAKEIVRDAALLVEPKNPQSIAKGIETLLEDSALRKKFGMRGKELVKKEYSIRNTVDQLESMYESLLRKNQGVLKKLG